MKRFDYIIYGNNVGAMVSAIELAKEHKVAIINPAKGWGATLGGMFINGKKFDIGMNFFEFVSFHTASDDLSTYSPNRRNDSARFFHLVEKYIAQYCDFTEAPAPSCYVEKGYFPDYAMTNRLEFLNEISDDLKNTIKGELKVILAQERSPLHASNKKKNEDLFVNTSYEKVSIANHGITFHQKFIEPLCLNIIGASSSELPSLFHRVAWVPLFYPETLLEAIDGKLPTGLSTPFHYPKKGYFSDFIEKITPLVTDNQNISVFSDNDITIKQKDDFHISFSGHEEIVAHDLVWCADFQKLLSSANITYSDFPIKKASVVLIFLEINREAINQQFSSLYVIDDNTPLYRITDQDFTAQNGNPTHRLVFEMNFDRCANFGLNDEIEILKHLKTELQNMGLFNQMPNDEDFTVRIFRNAVNLPIKKHLDYHKELQQLANQKLKNVHYIGISANFGTTSFNDQIVQSLKLAQ